jgi:bifunctional ADP-heptose synthase (sugar kinase/adenylyltransferase)
MRVAVIGDSMLDIRRSGYSSRVSPEDPNCKVLTNANRQVDLGGAANLAKWLAGDKSLKVDLYTRYTQDEAGRDLVRLCKSADIEICPHLCCYDWGYCTTIKERVCLLDAENRLQQLVRCDQEIIKDLSSYDYYYTVKALTLNAYEMIVVADYDKGMFRGIHGEALRQVIADQKGITIVNSKCPDRWAKYSLNFLVCNAQEALQIGADVATILGKVESQCLIVTRSERGAAVYNRNWDRELPAGTAKALDVTGCGDAFTAGFAVRYLGQDKVEYLRVVDALQWGLDWAEHCLKQVGCGMPPKEGCK